MKRVTSPRDRRAELAAAMRPTLLDRAIAYIDPVRGVNRLRARGVMALTTGGYNGASKSRRSLATWNAGNGSADATILQDLETLRDRSRDLVRNTPIAAGAINTVVTRVVGTGLALQPAIDHEVLGLTREQARDWQRDVKRRWNTWAESTWCDITARQTFYGLQALALRAALEAGDTFALLPMLDLRGRPSELAIKLVEGDRICNKDRVIDKPQLAGGIEMDEDGRPLYAHILKQHPGNLYGHSREWDVVPFFGEASGRRNVLHVCDILRPGQTRGVPYLAPVMEALKNIGTYTQAEIDAAVVSSFFTVFTTSEDGGQPDPLESAVTGELQASDTRKGEAWDGTMGSGLAVELPAGTKVDFANPARPNQAFDPFVLAVLRQIGTALEIPFELLVKHFTSSYTAARAALLDFWLFVRRRREWMAATFCQPVYEEWLRLEVASGRVNAPGYFASPLVRSAWHGAYWVGDAMGVLDPQREASANRDNLELGITTREKLAMHHDGSDWEDINEQLRREEEARREAGLATPPRTTAPGQGNANAND